MAEHRKVETFDQIDVSGAIQVVVEIADEPTVVVETDDNLQKYVATDVRGKKLVIRQTEDIDPTKLQVRITTPSLTSLDSSGATKARISGLTGSRFALDLSGAAEVVLAGEVDVFVIDASGASTVDAQKLIAGRVEVDGSGASDFSVHAEHTLIADLSGAGELKYWGNPSEVKTDLSGAASIEQQ